MKTKLKNLFNRLRRPILHSAFCILTSLALTVQGQGVPPSANYSVGTVTLNYTTLPGGVPGTTGYGTNLANGWSQITTSSNVYTTWVVASNAFVTVTNSYSTTNTTYAIISTISQKDLGLVCCFGAGAATTNRILTFCPVLDNGTLATNTTWTWSMLSQANSYTTFATNYPASFIGGYGGVALINDLWQQTNGLPMTNQFLKFGNKKYAF